MEENKTSIAQKLAKKYSLEQEVFGKVKDSFLQIENILQELSAKYIAKLKDNKIPISYEKIGKYDLKLQIGADILIFSMFPNVFMFSKENIIWKHSYMKQNPENGYVGQIAIYNFLSDSFERNHNEDLGYLVARLFINKESHYVLEGKRQLSYRNHDISECIINKKRLTEIIETAINYALDFDLLVPPYDAIKIVSVGQMKHKAQESKSQTGKRLGFQFNTDDV